MMRESLRIIADEIKQLTPHERVMVLIEYGQDFDQCGSCKNEKFRVPRCMSETYVKIELSDERIVIKGYSDSLTVAGYIAL